MSVSFEENTWDVGIVGGGVAGLTAGIFTARNKLDTLIVNSGTSILCRNAHLENYPGFPMGINPRILIEMIREQAERAGADFLQGRVTEVSLQSGDFLIDVKGSEIESSAVIVSSWSDVDYLESLDVNTVTESGKTFVKTDEQGRTNIDSLYAAGRITGIEHQAVIAAGDGASTGLGVINDMQSSFYHDWVTPDGYFTGRERPVPEGCEEIPDSERLRREEQSLDRLNEYFSDILGVNPVKHPSQQNDS